MSQIPKNNIPKSLRKKWAKTTSEIKENMKNGNMTRKQYDRCSKCIWVNKIDKGVVFCPFSRCFLTGEKKVSA